MSDDDNKGGRTPGDILFGDVLKPKEPEKPAPQPPTEPPAQTVQGAQ